MDHDDGGCDDVFGAPHFEKKALNIWTSPGGKVRLAKTLLPMLHGPHDTYTEGFAGSGALFFRKDKVATEALNDLNPEIAMAFKDVQALTDGDIDLISKMYWHGDRARFMKQWKTDPKTLSKIERVYRYLYISRFSFGNMIAGGFEPAAQGKVTKIWKRLGRARDRLKGVNIYTGSYVDAVKRHDRSTALHYLDPPYPGYNARLKESEFNEQEFLDTIKALQGRFLVTYGVRGTFPGLVKDTDFTVRRIYPRRAYAVTGNMGGAGRLGTLIVSNYNTTASTQKAFDDEYVVEDWSETTELLIEAANAGYLYKSVDFTPSLDMAVLANAGMVRLERAQVSLPAVVQRVIRKVANREELDDVDAVRLANALSIPSPETETGASLHMALGGDAGRVWTQKVFERMCEMEIAFGDRRFHPVGDIALPAAPIVVQKDCVVMADGGALVYHTSDDDIGELIEKAIPVPDDVAQNKAMQGHSAYEHTPLYDLVLVPSQDFGHTRPLVKALGDLDYEKGDTGVASIQLWGTGVDEGEIASEEEYGAGLTKGVAPAGRDRSREPAGEALRRRRRSPPHDRDTPAGGRRPHRQG
jgi:DNA adenine methylase